MSQIVVTDVGRFHIVTDGKTKWPLWECPHCGERHQLQEAQMEGNMPVVCLGYPEAEVPHYFEGHEFGKALRARLIACRLTHVGSFPVNAAGEVIL